MFEADRLTNHLIAIFATKKKAEEAVLRWGPLVGPGNDLFIETWRVNGERIEGGSL
jgi:hypothetical protein